LKPGKPPPFSRALARGSTPRRRARSARGAGVSECPDHYPLSEREAEVLNQRLDAYRSNPRAVSPWPEVRRRVLRSPES